MPARRTRISRWSLQRGVEQLGRTLGHTWSLVGNNIISKVNLNGTVHKGEIFCGRDMRDVQSWLAGYNKCEDVLKKAMIETSIKLKVANDALNEARAAHLVTPKQEETMAADIELA